MKKKLVIIGTYLPGYKAGGPVLSIANLIDCLGDAWELNFLKVERQIEMKNDKIQMW